MYAIFEQLLKRDGLTISEVGRATGISPSTFTDWRAGRYKPKADKMKRIADYFGVSVDYLTTGKDTPKESASGKIYYFNDETAAAAQEMFDDPDLRALMDAARGCPSDVIKNTTELLRRFKETNPNG